MTKSLIIFCIKTIYRYLHVVLVHLLITLAFFKEKGFNLAINDKSDKKKYLIKFEPLTTSYLETFHLYYDYIRWLNASFLSYILSIFFLYLFIYPLNLGFECPKHEIAYKVDWTRKLKPPGKWNQRCCIMLKLWRFYL